MMGYLEVILPISLLFIAFLLKLAVNQDWKNVPNLIQNICELPADIIFLALSFCVAFTISDKNNHGIGLSYCFIGVGIAILIVYVRKICVDLFLSKKKIWILLFLINLIISVFAINQSIKLIINRVDETVKQESIEQNGNTENTKEEQTKIKN